MADTFVKPPFYLSAAFLNDVNDSLQGGQLTTLPTGYQQFQQNVPGDRIILDDATAFALSDTTVGTLYGGIYMYVNTLSTSTAAPAVGSIAFFSAASIGGGTGTNTVAKYQVSADANPTTVIPTFIVGVFINALTKGNLGWVQVAGIASVLFDSTVTSTVSGNLVVAKASASVASTADCTTIATMTALLTAQVIGVAIGTVTTSTVSKVAITRGIARL